MSLSTTRSIVLDVNGERYARSVEVRRLLSDFLREDLGLTGTHVGCEGGVCGACTIDVDGELVRSCLMLAVQADRSQVTTIEGVAPATGLHPVQQALHDARGLQCGFCTPGIVMTLRDLVARGAALDDAALRRALAGNLCRCTGYVGVLAAARTLLDRKDAPA